MSWYLALVAAAAVVVCWRTLRSARAWQREAALLVDEAVTERHAAARDAAEHLREMEERLRWVRAIAEEHELAALDDLRRQP